MATICKDCIQNIGLDTQSDSTPCDSLVASFIVNDGRLGISETYILVPKDNPLSLVGFDYYFESSSSKRTYNIVYTGTQWVVLNELGEKIYYSNSTGANNNLCPPTSGWTDITGEFLSFFIEREILPGPSDSCSNTNGTFDSNITGWTGVNFIWDAGLGGSVKYDSASLGSLTQSNILTIGETYTISFDYQADASRDICTPTQYDQGFIKVYAGTKVHSFKLDNTFGRGVQTLTIELTCEGNTNLKIEVQDPNLCYGTANGYKGVFVDNVCAVLKTNVTDPTGPSPLRKMQYRDMAEVPAQINKSDYNTRLTVFQECLATKGTTFYNKVVGAVKCDHRELSKLKLIIELLGQKNEDRALDCVYDRQIMPTAVYPALPTGTLTVTTANQKVVVLTGDISQFETFDLNIPALSGFISEIIDAVYNPTLDQTTITVKDNFPSTISNTAYTVSFESEVATSYLETFINFANQFCADCLTTGLTPPRVTPVESNLEVPPAPLVGESGVAITTEFNQQIIL